MTNKEAIDYLRPVADSTPLVGYGAALNLAIKALETVENLKQGLLDERYRHDRYLDYSRGQEQVIDALKAELKGKRTASVRTEKKQDKVIGKRKDTARKEKVIVCQMCGKEAIARANNAKYCEHCKKIASREKAKEYTQKTRVLISYDSEEMMKFCLDCKRPKCTGECEELANMVKRSKA